MKKILIILLLICSLFIIGCNTNKSYEKIYNKAIEIAERAYEQKGVTGEVEIEKFYGEYNGVYVLNTYLKGYDGMHRGVQGRCKVEDYIFTFGSIDNMAYAIYNDTFYRFDEAYELGLLTLGDIKDMYEVHCTAMLGEVRGAYYDKYLKDIDEASYKDVKLENFCKKDGLSYYRLSCKYIEDEEINEVFELGSRKFEFKNRNDMIYFLHDNKLYTIKEAYENFEYYKEHIKEIHTLYLEEFANKYGYEWAKEYYYKYMKNIIHISLDDIEVTNIIGVYGTVIVAQVQPGYGPNLNSEKRYEIEDYVFIFENDYYDLDIINLSSGSVHNLDKYYWSLDIGDIRDIWNKLYDK